MATGRPSYRFPRSARLRGRKAFQELFERRVRTSDQRLMLYAAPNGRRISRLGIAVNRRYGHAVRRNRIKRLIRESFRLIRPELPGGLDVLVVPRPGREPALSELQDSLRELIRRLQSRLQQEAGPTTPKPARS